MIAFERCLSDIPSITYIAFAQDNILSVPWVVLAAGIPSNLLLIALGLLLLALVGGGFWASSQLNALKGQLDSVKSELKNEQEARREAEAEAAKVKAEAEAAVKEAEDADDAKGTFLATMSHEIRTPLNCILGLSEVLMASEPTDEQKDYLESIRSSINALLAIIGNVLDYSKIEAGKLELAPERFNLGEMLTEIQKLFFVQAREKNLEFSCTMDKEDVPLHVTCDRNHLRQILINLVGNAIKFTEKGGVKLEVFRERIPPEKSPVPGKVYYVVQFRVTDTGMGVDPDRREELFQPFHQLVGSKTRKYEGTGLGLAICKRIVDAMDGEIAVEANESESQGSVFIVELVLQGFSVQRPTQPPLAKPKQPAGSGLYKHALGQSFYSHKVLVADDNPLNCKMMKSMMEKMGHTADFVVNGQEAVEYLKKTKVDIVFMDIMMPVVDGIEATRMIRAGDSGEENQNVPIVALTAFALTSDREKFLSCGMDLYLTKPVEPDILREMMTDLARKFKREETKS